MSKWDVLCDGGCPKPGGPGAWAYVIKTGCTLVTNEKGESHPEGGIVRKYGAGFLPTATNNQAEYRAQTAAYIKVKEVILAALSQGSLHLPNEVRFWGDSQLIVYHITGKYKVSDTTLRPYYETAMEELRDLRQQMRHFHAKASVNWCRREYNSDADEYCNKIFDKHGVALQKVRKK